MSGSNSEKMVKIGAHLRKLSQKQGYRFWTTLYVKRDIADELGLGMQLVSGFALKLRKLLL